MQQVMQGRSSRKYGDKNVKSEAYKVLLNDYEWAETHHIQLLKKKAVTKNNEIIRFQCGIFIVFVGSSDYVASSGGNTELERMWEESAMAYFKALSWTEEKHETFRIVCPRLYLNWASPRSISSGPSEDV